MTSFSTYVDRSIRGPPYRECEEMTFEVVRLLSFRLWPLWSILSPILLAKEGFYHTGRNDETRCFSCGSTKKNWGNISSSREEHKNLSANCKHLRGSDESNVPIYVPLPTELEQLKSKLLSPNGDICTESIANNPNILPVLPEHLESVEDMLRKAPDRLHRPIQIIDFSQDYLPSATPTKAADANSMVADARNLPNSETDNLECVSEYHNQYKYERKRLLSFENWSYSANIRPAELSKAGFYSLLSGDRVQCAFCSGILRNWESGDNAMHEHRRLFPSCKFIRSIESGNVPLSLSEYTIDDTLNDPTLGIIRDKPHNPRYAVLATQLASFGRWPSNKKQTPQMMSKAGFFYAGWLIIRTHHVEILK